MSNPGHGGGYIVHPVQPSQKNTVITAGGFPANQNQQAFLTPSSQSPVPARALELHQSAVPSPTLFHPTSHRNRPVRPARSHLSRMTAPFIQSPFTTLSTMDSYPCAPAFMSPAELHMESQGFYPSDMPNSLGSPFGPRPFNFRNPHAPFSHGQNFFYQDMGSPHNTGSSQDFGSPSITDGGMSERTVDQPYAKLIYEALRSAPSHSMVLQDIYSWFEQHTQKPQRTPNGSSGWKNSIRHNLSMNKAFVKVEKPGNAGEPDGKKLNLWRLSDQALTDGGVLSTTRYREKTTKARRQNSDILHQRYSQGGKVVKRSPRRDSGPFRFEPSFDAALAEMHSAPSVNVSGLDHLPTAYEYSCSSLQAPEEGKMPTNMAQDLGPSPGLGPGRGAVAALPRGGGPPSPVSSLSSGLDAIHPGLVTDQGSPDIKLGSVKVEGVSSNAHNYALFEHNETKGSSERELHHPVDGNGEAVRLQSMSDLGDMPIPMIDEFSTWSVEEFGQLEYFGQGNFFSKL